MQWQTELTKQNSENENYEDKLNYLLKSWKVKIETIFRTKIHTTKLNHSCKRKPKPACKLNYTQPNRS